STTSPRTSTPHATSAGRQSSTVIYQYPGWAIRTNCAGSCRFSVVLTLVFFGNSETKRDFSRWSLARSSKACGQTEDVHEKPEDCWPCRHVGITYSPKRPGATAPRLSRYPALPG